MVPYNKCVINSIVNEPARVDYVFSFHNTSMHQSRTAHYCLLKGPDGEWLYHETIHYYYQYRILYFSNFYDVNKKIENIATLLSSGMFLPLYPEWVLSDGQ